MFVKPSSAFVGCPSVVWSSSGSAKYARYARLLPSTRKSSEPFAGPSSSCSSSPVSVFGLTAASVTQPGALVREDDRKTVQRGRRGTHSAALYSARMLVTPTFARHRQSFRSPEEHLDGAAVLLAERHRAHRLVEPGLDPRYEEPGARTRGGRRAPPRGRRVRSRRPGGRPGRRLRRRHSSRRELGPEHVGGAGGPRRRRMPSSCATSTRRPRNAGSPTASRCTTRWCRLPIDALVDAWFRLGFGHQQVYAIRETPPAARAHRGAAGA